MSSGRGRLFLAGHARVMQIETPPEAVRAMRLAIEALACHSVFIKTLALPWGDLINGTDKMF